MRVHLRHKVVGLAIFSALIPIVALFALIFSQRERLVKRFDADFNLLVDKNLTDSVHQLWNMCAAVNELVESKVNTNIRVAQQYINNLGPIRLEAEEPVLWRAENQVTREYLTLELPKLYLGPKAIEQNFNDSVPTPVVDDIRSLVQSTVSVFQKMNDHGDMLRVASTLLRPDGSRDISQFLPAFNPSADPDQTIPRVLKGETVYSSTHIIDEWYIFAAAPLRETATGNIIGMVRTAISQNSLHSLRAALANFSLGKHGFAWVIRGHHVPEKDFFVYPTSVDSDYAKLSNILQNKGVYFFENLRKQATAARPGHVLTETFQWQPPEDKGDNQLQMVIKYVYFPKWDWIIGLATYEQDYMPIHNKLREPFSYLIHAILWSAAMGLILVLLLSSVLGNRITRPIARLSEIIAKIAQGRLHTANVLVSRAIQENRSAKGVGLSDETDQLFDAIRHMVMTLSSLVSHVKQAAAQLIHSSNHISGTAKMQETAVSDFREASKQIAASVGKISTTSQQLYQTLCNISEIASESGKMADEGRNQLVGMESSMQHLAKSTSSIAAKLSMVTQKAANINNIVVTISKVGDQAEVLSVNASIESEKAGEYGRGFSVVSKEIARLAAQTSLATSDIDHIVREMNHAISATVNEIDKFKGEVLGSISEVNRLSTRLEGIIEQVQVLSPRFDSIKEGMESQYEGAKKINQAASNLSEVAKRSTHSLDNFEQAKALLNQAIDSLRHEVSTFEVIDPVQAANDASDRSQAQRLLNLAAIASEMARPEPASIDHD